MDYDEYIKKQEQFCKAEWLSIVSEDFADGEAKWAIAGLHEHNKLFVRFGTGWPNGKTPKLLRLELFDVESLQHFSKSGKILLGSKEGENSSWKIEAYFIVEEGIAKEVELSVKTGSNFQAITKRIGIQIVNKKLQKGQETTVSKDVDVLDLTGLTYKLPETVSTGASYPENETAPAKIDFSQNAATGDIPLKITQSEEVFADQTWERDGQFKNLFYTNLDIVNTSNEVIAITNVKSEYLDSNQKWNDVQTYIGSKQRFYSYSWNNSNKFNLEPLQQLGLAIDTEIPIKAVQWDRERRAHKSLPSPLSIRITFEDAHGRKSTITAQYANGPLNLPTKKSKEDYDKKTYDLWFQCDDTDLETRVIAKGQRITDTWGDYVTLQMGTSSSTHSFSKPSFRKYVWDAVKNNKDEVTLEDSGFEQKGCSGTASVLVDLKNKKAYAIKVSMKTTTGSVVGYFPIPHLADKN